MSHLPPISFEFFPPRDAEGRERLTNNVAAKLSALNPHFFSVTYGAGGSTRDGTRQTVEELNAAGYDAAPHLSMGNDDALEIKQALDRYAASGVKRIVALRGDQPSGMGTKPFSNNAEALVRLIRNHSGNQFHLEVAAYPETHPDAPSAGADLVYFKRKVDAGADSAITQYFYNVDAYEDFLNRCVQANINIPIVPGLMPITNLASLIRFSDRCGADIPRWLRHVLLDLEDDDQGTLEFGIEVLTKICERLISLNVPGLHFYTLNRWGATTRICNNLS